MKKNTKWSDGAWSAAEHIYKSILDLPFVKELAAGTLPGDTFMRYIGQDSLYINTYCKVLSHIASRLTDMRHVEAFIRFAGDGVAVEQALHSFYIDERPAEMSPACKFYTSLLKAQAYEDVAVEAAAVLPCFWVYQQVGKNIAANAAGGDNPYAEWINTYSDPAFEQSTALAIEICDALAENATEEIRRRMTDIFVECTRMEWLFWHGAYENLKWPI